MTTKLQQVIKAKVMAEAIAEAWAAEALAAEARAVVWAAAAEAWAEAAEAWAAVAARAEAGDWAEVEAEIEAVARAVAKAEAKAARAKDLAEARTDWTEAVARAVAKAEAKAAELLPHWAIIDPKSSEAS